MTRSAYAARFFHDWGSGTWLWAADDATRARFGYPIDHQDLGLPHDVAAELDRLADWHDTALNWDDPASTGPWRQEECDRFNRAVEEVFPRLRRALGATWALTYQQARETEG